MYNIIIKFHYYFIILILLIFNFLNAENFDSQYPLNLSIKSQDQFEECGSIFLDYTFFENNEFQGTGECANTQYSWNTYGTWKFGDEQKGRIAKINLVIPGESQDIFEALTIREDNSVSYAYEVNSLSFTLLNSDEFKSFFIQSDTLELVSTITNNTSPLNLENGIRYCIQKENANLSTINIRNNKLINFNNINIEEVLASSENIFQGKFKNKDGREKNLYYVVKNTSKVFFDHLQDQGYYAPFYEEMTLTDFSSPHIPDETFSCFIPRDKKNQKELLRLDTIDETVIFSQIGDEPIIIALNNQETGAGDIFFQQYEGWNFTEEERKEWQIEKEKKAAERLKSLKKEYNNPSGRAKCERAYKDMQGIFYNEGYAKFVADPNYIAQVWGECQAVFPGEYEIY